MMTSIAIIANYWWQQLYRNNWYWYWYWYPKIDIDNIIVMLNFRIYSQKWFWYKIYAAGQIWANPGKLQNVSQDQHDTASSAQFISLSIPPFSPSLPNSYNSPPKTSFLQNAGRTTQGQLGVMSTQGLHVWTSSVVSGKSHTTREESSCDVLCWAHQHRRHGVSIGNRWLWWWKLRWIKICIYSERLR